MIGWTRRASLVLRLGLVAVAGALAWSFDGESVRQDPQGSIESEVKAFLARYLEAIESSDVDGLREALASDGRFSWYTDGVKAYASVDDVVAGLQRFRGSEARTDLSSIEVVSIGDRWASVRSEFRTELSFGGGGTHEFGGVITWLLEKERGGWRLLLGHTSTPAGPPAVDGGSEERSAGRTDASRGKR